jgi:germination protein M
MESHAFRPRRSRRPEPRVRSSTLAGLALLPLLIVAAACGNDDTSTTATTTSAATATTTATTTASTTTTTTAPIVDRGGIVFFVRGEQVATAGRAVGSTPATALQDALAALFVGPSAFERDSAHLLTEIPTSSRLLGSRIDGTTAIVDVNSAFESGGGSLSMRLRVAEVVFTATRIAGVENVRFSIEGKPVVSIGGEGVMVDNVTRKAFVDLTPPIITEYPAPGALVRSPLVVNGLSNVFEGTVNVDLLGPDGKVLASGFGTGMMGDWGPYETALTFTAPTSGTGILRSYEVSAQDGTPIHIVDTPVRF